MKKGWEVKKMGELCEIKTGRRDANHGNPNGVYHFFTCAKDHSYIDDYSFDTEAILVAGNGDVGAVKYFKGKFDAYQRTYVLKDFEATINVRFLFILLHGYLKDTVAKQKLGNTMPYIKVGMLKNFQVPLPPLPEQQRIVEILDKAFVAIDKAKQNAEQNLRNAKEVFENYLHGVFDDKGDDWEDTSLKKEISLATGFAFKSKYYTTDGEDILLLRGDNIMQGNFRWKDAKRWDKSEYDDFEKYQLQENDIVLAMDRPWVKAGLKCARVSKSELPSLLVQRTARLRNKPQLDNSFLYYLIQSKGFTDYLIDIQTGIGVPHISGKQIFGFAFRKPRLKEQQQIVKKINSLSVETKKTETLYQQKLDNLDELKKSILQKAFRGEL
jgi:type I restriction enzyme, S subunit